MNFNLKNFKFRKVKFNKNNAIIISLCVIIILYISYNLYINYLQNKENFYQEQSCTSDSDWDSNIFNSFCLDSEFSNDKTCKQCRTDDDCQGKKNDPRWCKCSKQINMCMEDDSCG